MYSPPAVQSSKAQHAHQVPVLLAHDHLPALRRNKFQFGDQRRKLCHADAVRGLRTRGDRQCSTEILPISGVSGSSWPRSASARTSSATRTPAWHARTVVSPEFQDLVELRCVTTVVPTIAADASCLRIVRPHHAHRAWGRPWYWRGRAECPPETFGAQHHARPAIRTPDECALRANDSLWLPCASPRKIWKIQAEQKSLPCGEHRPRGSLNASLGVSILATPLSYGSEAS